MASAKSCVSSTAINRDSVCSASRGPGSMYSPIIRPASRNVAISNSWSVRVVFLEPFVGDFRGYEHLEMIGMADVLIRLSSQILAEAPEERMPHLALGRLRSIFYFRSQ